MMLALDASMRIDSAHNTLVLDSVPDAEDSSVLITPDGTTVWEWLEERLLSAPKDAKSIEPTSFAR